MFPYPSGDGLHMGHTEGYSATDIYYRFKRMQGYNVLHPQGFDSFGLPAENYAIKTGTHPSITTEKNSSNYIEQMNMLGLAHDVSGGVYTSKPEFYKWTQWMFGEFFENGHAYRKTDTVNWCESCQTVIANEQVEDGECERCGTEIIQKDIPSWFFKITDHADDLISGLDELDWPEATKKKQINWIGKSEGAEIDFKIKNREEQITVFTTRPDTLYGVTFMVLAPESELVQSLISTTDNADEVNEYIDQTKKKSELDRLEAKEKTGVQLKGVFAINPANNEEIPVFVADYVLANYGTGAVMAVPAHDERDNEFAQKYGLPIKQVVQTILNESEVEFERSAVYGIIKKNDKYLLQHFKKRDFYWFPGGGIEEGEDTEDALIRELREETPYENFEIVSEGAKVGLDFRTKGRKIMGRNNGTFFLVNLLDSKETEISLTESEIDEDIELKWLTKEEFKNIADSNIPGRTDLIKLAYKLLFENCIQNEYGYLVDSGIHTGLSSQEAMDAIIEKVSGRKKSTYRLRDWSISRQRYWGTPIPIVYSPEGMPQFVGEENLPWTLPTDVDFVPKGMSPLADSKELQTRVTDLFGEGWTPEYDTMDTFVDSSWYYLRYPDPHNTESFCGKEMKEKWLPVDMYFGGAEHAYMHLLYARYVTKVLHGLGHVNFTEPFTKLRHPGMVNDKDGKKMSKSKGNVVNPNEMVEKFGADAVRTYMMFAAPLEDDVIWNEDNIVGVRRFLEKVWSLKEKLSDENNTSFDKELHKTLRQVTEQMEELKFNTVVSDLMKLTNTATKEESIGKEQYRIMLQMLNPMAPHITEFLISEMSGQELLDSMWPTFDTNLAVDDEKTIGVQVNGKRRGDISVSDDDTEDTAMEMARAVESINKFLNEGEIVKVIYVPGKILNIVVK